MKQQPLKSLNSLDSAVFGAIIRSFGFSSGALYKQEGDCWIQVLSTDGEADWPVAMPVHTYYTTVSSAESPLGFAKTKIRAGSGNHRQKTCILYFPEQDFYDTQLVFMLRSAPGKRVKVQELHAGLEACATRCRGLMDRSRQHRFVSEEGFREHIRALGVDLRSMIEHELRTPLASVTGYFALLENLEQEDLIKTFQEYQLIIKEQSTTALEALEKLSLTLHPDGIAEDPRDVDHFDPVAETEKLCTAMSEKAREYISGQAAERTQIRFRPAIDQDCSVLASPRLFRWALWEVIKNGVIHARHGQVDVEVYQTDNMFVVDISDDGAGLSPGSEELVFLRFYQDPSTFASRKGKRGLGLGLFLARQIVERHMGKLFYVRKPNRTGTFRFLWPVATGDHQVFKREA